RALQLGHADAAAGRERRENGLVRSVFQQQRARHCHAALKRRLYFARRERLAAQDAVLVGERKAHALQLVRFDFLEDVHAAQAAWRRRFSSASFQYSSMRAVGPMPSIAGGPDASFRATFSSPASFFLIASTSRRR